MRSPSRVGVVGLRLALVVTGLFAGRPAVAQGVKEFLYAGNAGDDTVSGYVKDATTGALTPIPGSPFVAG